MPEEVSIRNFVFLWFPEENNVMSRIDYFSSNIKLLKYSPLEAISTIKAGRMDTILFAAAVLKAI